MRPEPVDVDSLRVVDLKAELKKRGIKVPKARKAELQELLREAVDEEQRQWEAANQSARAGEEGEGGPSDPAVGRGGASSPSGAA